MRWLVEIIGLNKKRKEKKSVHNNENKYYSVEKDSAIK